MSVSFDEGTDGNIKDSDHVVSVSKLLRENKIADEERSVESEGEDDFNENLGTLAKSNSDMLPFSLKQSHSGPETGVTPRRPEAIGALLDGVNDRFETGEEMYSTFIEMASESIREERNSGLYSVRTNLKFNESIGNPALEAFDGSMNSSLVRIFMFYAAIQNPTSASTFSATAVENETMSFYELDKMARDFHIVPKFLTKAELKVIWDDFVYINAIRSGCKPINALTFENFQDLFVRMALYAYSKPGMKKMILAVTGFFPGPQEIVLFMCHQLNLDNFQMVKDHLMNRGRDTQGAINYRSAEEINWRAREEHLIDLRAKQLERVTAKEKSQTEREEKERQRKIRKKQGQESLLSQRKGGAGNKKKSVQYGLWSSLGGQEFGFSQSKMSRKKVKEQESRIPDEIRMLLEGKGGDGESNDKGLDAGPSQASSGSGMKSKEIADAGHNHHPNADADHNADANANDDIRIGGNSSSDDEDTMELSADGLETYDKAMMRARRKGTRLPALKDYSDTLVYVLKEYSRREPERAKPNIIDSGGGFLDCGSLRPNTECKVTVELTNLMLDIATLDVQAVGFPDENTDIVTYAKPLVSGMTRQISINFNVGMREGCTLAQALITLVTNHTRLEVILPVFMRVDHSTAPRIVANVRTMDSLSNKYHGVFKPATTAFDRKKDRDSEAWVKPSELAMARRSVHESLISTHQRETLARRIKSRDKQTARQAEKEAMKQSNGGSLATLHASLSDYLPTIPGAKLPSAEEVKANKSPQASASLKGGTRPRKTSFFAEGTGAQLHRPKHLQ